MAGDWIKVEHATPDKPEVWEVAELLSMEPDSVVGKMLRVWIWFDQQTEEGIAPATSIGRIDRLVGHPGFCDGLIAVGWMDRDEENIILPNFETHNGATAKRRAATARRVAGHRARKEGNAAEKRAVIPRPVRRMILERDGNACVYCGRKAGTYRLMGETSRDGRICLDHVVPATRGGPTTPDNLVCACNVCNMHKTDRTPDECGLPWPLDKDGNRYGWRYISVTSGVTSALPREEKRREEDIEGEREAGAKESQYPTLDQAKAAAGMVGVTDAEAETWWEMRSANGWLKSAGGGATIPVADWRSDMKRHVNQHIRQAQKAPTSAPSGHHSPPQRRREPWQIENEIASIEKQVNAIQSDYRNHHKPEGSYEKKLKPDCREQVKKLNEAKANLQTELRALLASP